MFGAATFVLALSAISSVTAASCAREYTVKQGDICDSISKNEHVSSYQLQAINPQIDDRCFNLVPGEVLCLGANAAEDCKDVYTVQRDDSCQGIQDAHSVNSTLLFTNNPQINTACDNLYIGQVLCVAKSVQVPAAPATGIPGTKAHQLQAATKSTVIVSSTVTASTVTSSPIPTETESATDIDESGDPNDETLPFCDEL